MNTGLTHSNLNDFEIVDRVLGGDIAVYEILIRRYNPLLYKLGRSYSFQHEDVQDLMQETFISAYEKLYQFQRRSQLGTWLTRIMINKCLYKMKTQNKNKEVTLETDDNNWQHYMASLKDKEFPLQNELKKIIELSLEKLPEPYRLVFLLRETENFSVAETAEVMNITPVNVKVRLNRAKTMMREYLEQWYTKTDIYDFNLKYCSLVVENVLTKIRTFPANNQ
jgi:RNA polymerase sigma-70 factor (ECF subfamily)